MNSWPATQVKKDNILILGILILVFPMENFYWLFCKCYRKEQKSFAE